MTSTVTVLARLATILAAVVALSAPAASAQSQTGTPSDPGNPQTAFLSSSVFARLALGRNVRVTNIDGSSQKGEVTRLSQTEFIVGGARVPYSQVAKVERVSHRILTGTLVGAGIGGGFAGLMYGLCVAADDEYCGTNTEFFVSLLYTAGIGGGVGAAIGALRNLSKKDADVLYDASRGARTVALIPIVSPTRKGVAFLMTWR